MSSSFIKAYGMCKTLQNLSYLFCFWNNHSAIVSDQLDFQTCCSAVFELVWFSAFHRALKCKNLIKIEDWAFVRIVIVPNISRVAAVVFCPVRPELFPRNHLARSFRVFWGHSQVINPKIQFSLQLDGTKSQPEQGGKHTDKMNDSLWADDFVAELSKALHLGCSLHWRRFKSCRSQISVYFWTHHYLLYTHEGV